MMILELLTCAVFLINCLVWCRERRLKLAFIALRGMQTLSSDEKAVCLSVCLSVCQTRAL